MGTITSYIIQIDPTLAANGLVFTDPFVGTFSLFNSNVLPPANFVYTISNTIAIADSSQLDQDRLDALFAYIQNNPGSFIIFSMPSNVFNQQPVPTTTVINPDDGSSIQIVAKYQAIFDIGNFEYISPNPFNPNQLIAVYNVVACLHGSSLIQMKEGTKRIDQIKEGDEVLSHDSHGNHRYAQVKGVPKCWLSFMGVDHDAIIFEPGSLNSSGDEFEPSQKLIIDPGHPMCTQKEYSENGSNALRPAGTFWEELKGDKIYTKKWTDIGSRVRYDLILEEPYNTYIANGMVVRAKGYKDHKYKEFV